MDRDIQDAGWAALKAHLRFGIINLKWDQLAWFYFIFPPATVQWRMCSLRVGGELDLTKIVILPDV